MRKILYIAIVALLFASCDDFLEPKSQDKVIPVKVSQLKEFLLGEVIAREYNSGSRGTDFLRLIDIMTDDVHYFDPSNSRRDLGGNLFGYYTWARKPEVGKNNEMVKDYNWDGYYKDVFTCNMIIDQIPDMEGTDEEKYELYAQTYFMRANSYFMLVNLYGEPYVKETALQDLGVPINNETGIVNYIYERSSVEAVYYKIQEDLRLSIENFKKVNVPDNVALPTLNAAYLLASRVSLYKKEYKDAKDYADLLIGRMRGRLANLNVYKEDYFVHANNPEIIFTYGITDNYLSRRSRYSIYVLSEEFMNLFESDDLRYDLYFPRDDPKKYFKGKGNCYGKAFRLTEAYLNRAEALAYLDNIEDAIDDINEIRRNRFEDGEEYEIAANDKQTAIDYIRRERRMELSFENGHRWFDLRRYGKPRLIHIHGKPGEEITYVLEEGSNAYTLPIPDNVIKLNNVIEQIDRPEVVMGDN